MYRIIDGSARDLVDVGKFIDLINHLAGELSGFFNREKDISVARAPGRLDVMGGIADYSGSLVLQMPIAEATLAAVQPTKDRTVDIVSLSRDSQEMMSFNIALDDLVAVRDGYNEMRKRFACDPSSHWAAYVTGAFSVLSGEYGFAFSRGAKILISSDVPIGKGVSSSAALEVAVMKAVCAAYKIAIDPVELSLLCQKLENEIAGAACGVMDQIASNCGVENSLLAILCQPAEIQGAIAIPDRIEFWGIDSGVRHAVSGSDYSSVRVGASMGYRIIADLAGLTTRVVGDRVVEIDDPRWHGYLCNISPGEFSGLKAQIPVELSGSEFLEKYGGTTDQVTMIDAEKKYPVKAATSHPVFENDRVKEFSALLASDLVESVLDRMGELMFLSHESYERCGLTEGGTNRLVQLVRENSSGGLYGARITGGGSGGTVAVLSRANNEKVIFEIAKEYSEETGRQPYIFRGSSPGADTFGSAKLSDR